MAGAEKIGLTVLEQEKFSVITHALRTEITNEQAALLLNLSVRQVQRLKKQVRLYGAHGVRHHLKGKPSNHQIDPIVKEKTLAVIQEKYHDFKPTFASEKLAQQQGIKISPETTRLWMIKKGIWQPRKQRKIRYRAWRERRAYFGEMEQFDGSYHCWFEDRHCDARGDPIEVCLLASIDDATSAVTKAVFTSNEGIEAVFTFWKTYCEKQGKPIALYLDKFSTYKINHVAAVDNSDLITQFERAMKQLSVKLISAHSPQAKGRIERLFQTFQDRLVKEMRLANICTPTQGDNFLRDIFLPRFNQQFSVSARQQGNVHRPLLSQEEGQINHIFSIHATRKVHHDFTIQFKNKWYQLTEIQPTTIKPHDVVLIETWLDQTIHLLLKNFELSFFILPERPRRMRQPLLLTTHALHYIPPANHPWRKFAFGKSK